MKTDDIFEALTDIDDKFIAEAHPTDLNGDQPILAHPAPKNLLWKTLVPIAACAAVLVAAGAFGVNYLRGHDGLTTSSPSESKDFWYPEEAKFVVSEKFFNDMTYFNPSYPANGKHFERWDNTDYYAQSYDELAAQSDLIVVGEFADLPHQAQDPNETHVRQNGGVFVNEKGEIKDTTDNVGTDALMLNYLSVDRVIKGDIKEGGYVLIKQETSISRGGENVVQINAFDRLTPMFKGDRWIYFLKKNGDVYEPVNGPQGRYPMPESSNIDVSNSGEIAEMAMIDKYMTLPNSAPARDEIYGTLLDMLEEVTVEYGFKEVNIPLPGARNDFVMEEFPGYWFTATYEGVLLNGYKMNALDMPIISGDPMENLFLCDLNGDGRRELCATVVNDGVRSIDVIDFANNDKWYTLQGNRDYDYILEAENEVLTLIQSNKPLLDRQREPLSLDKMMPVLPGNDVTKIGDEKRFKLVEFSDKTFEIIDGKIVMDDIKAPSGTMRNSVISGIEYYLTDLNGDGKREICAWGSIGSGIDYRYIVVYDIANNESYYYKPPKALKELVSLDMEKDPLDDVLYVVTNEYYPDSDKEISREPLTLDILEKVSKSDVAYEDIPLFIDQTFTKEDFPGVEFTVDTTTEVPTFRFGWGSSVANNVNSVYLYDIDSDGKREICLNCPFAGNGCIRVYGYMDNGEMGCAVYYEDGGCWLNGGENGTLKYYTNDKIEPFKFSKSDLKPTFAQSYSYELLGWDHSIDFTEIVPTLGSYDVEIKERVLKIKHGGEQIFDSGIWLDELYSIPDMETNSVTLIYKTGDVGGACTIGVVRLSENSAERYDFGEGVSVKPTADELLLVNADGSEEPFRLPKDVTKLELSE